MRGLSDTHPKMERKLIEIQRAAGPERRVAMACALTDSVMYMSRAAVERSRAHLDRTERDLFFLRITYGRQLADRVRAYLVRRRAA